MSVFIIAVWSCVQPWGAGTVGTCSWAYQPAAFRTEAACLKAASRWPTGTLTSVLSATCQRIVVKP